MPDHLKMLSYLAGILTPEDGNVIEITYVQRAFIAMLAGVPHTTQLENGKLVTTTAKCGLVRMWGRWELFYQKEEP